MTLKHLAPTLLAACGLFVLACGDDTGKTDDTAPQGEDEICNDSIDNDLDGDTDCDDSDCSSDDACITYFEPFWMVPAAEFGLQGGEMANFSYQGTSYSPGFYITLAEEEYTDAWDDRYTCTLAYTITAAPGSSATGAFYDFLLTLTADEANSTCDNLDPNVWPDAHGYFLDWGWEFTIEDPDDTLIAFFADDYETYSSMLMGSSIYLGGEPLVDDQAGYVIFYAVDENMEITGDYGSAAAVAQGGDAYASLATMYLWGLEGR